MPAAICRTIARAPSRRMTPCACSRVKLAQGAKPSKGGILPGIKVTSEIYRNSRIPIGEDLISPNRHRDIANVREHSACSR